VEKEIKSCENCRYFVSYYTKCKTRYYKTFNGYCHENTRKKKPVLCDKWESADILKEERQQSVKKALINMSERLDEIALILKDEE